MSNKQKIPVDIQQEADRLYPKDESVNKQMNNPLVIEPLRNAYIQGRLDERAKHTKPPKQLTTFDRDGY